MKNYKLPLLIIAVSTLLIIVLTKGKTIMETASSKVWDWVSESRINTLQPVIRDKVRQFINQVEKETGIRLRVTRALSTFEEQAKLFAQGRTEPGKIVTNANAGESFHNYGLAFDVVEILNGAANWNTDWDKIAAIAKRFGFEWGGDFKTIKDKPHFQMTFGNSWQTLLAKYESGKMQDGYVLLA